MQSEQIYVVYTAITPESAPFYHKDLYYEKADGSVLYMRGAPGPGGLLTTSAQLLQPGSPQLDLVRSWELGREVLATGNDLSYSASLITAELARIDGLNINYENRDTNSNWAADKAILTAALPLSQFDGLFDFWSLGSIIESKIATRGSDSYRGGDPDLFCFPAGTIITMADGSEKVIDDIRVGDEVLSFDDKGNLVPGRVSRLLDNVTDTWLALSAADGRALGADTGAGDGRLVVTPGHRFLRPDGSFAEIQDIMADTGPMGGRIVGADGDVITVTAEVIRYGQEAAHRVVSSRATASAFVYGPIVRAVPIAA